MMIRLTPAVKVIAIICFAAFIVQQSADRWFDGNLLNWFGLVPAGFANEFRFWQLFTYAFLHGDVMHLFLNLLMLVFIGGEMEAAWGTRRFLKYYFFCAGVAGIFYLILQLFVFGGLRTPLVGASGAIYGLLVAYGIIYGERTLLFMLLFPMKAKHFIWILALLELMTTVFSPRGPLSGAAHLAGMAAGFGYLYVRATWQISQRRRGEAGRQGGLFGRKKKKKRSHLKLVSSDPNRFSRDLDDDRDDDPKTWH